jgi:hypothetical protein
VQTTEPETRRKLMGWRRKKEEESGTTNKQKKNPFLGAVKQLIVR